MGITGERFLGLSKAENFVITDHALDRLREYTGLEPSEDDAFSLFGESRQVRPEEMILMGYRPRYGRRLMEGQKSWYFRFLAFGEELIAVIGEGFTRGQFAWITAYGPTRQSELFRVADYETLAAA